MSGKARISRGQRRTIVLGILCFVALIVVLQLWLLSATVNAYIAGDYEPLVPAAIASLVCLALNAGLLRYLYRLEH